MKNGKNRKQSSSSVTEMDARTLLHTINTGAASQSKIFSERIRRMGKENDANFELVSLNSNSLIYEDTDRNFFYQADVDRQKGGKVKISNIRELRVVESQKSNMFKKNCHELVEAIAEDQQKDTDAIWSRISRQYFRPSTVPSSGVVVTRDGIARNIPVHGSIVPEDVKPFVVKAICEALVDRVAIDNKGNLVEATFSENEEKFSLPITELTRRKVVARYMKEAAEKAYLSEGFQKIMKNIAGLVSQNRIREAVRTSAGFLKEEQEFALLNKEESKILAENTLATIGNFNETLANDLGTLMYRTSCKVNKSDIVESWKMTARKAGYAPLVENTRMLEESQNFEGDYQEFLNSLFTEDATTRSVRADAYLTSLKQIRKVLEGTDQDQSILTSVDDYIMRLDQAGEEVDDATLYEVEDLLASVSQELVQDVQSLADYDDIPETPDMQPTAQFGDEDLSAEAPEEEGEIEAEAPPAPGAAPSGEQAAPELMAADKDRNEIPISEASEEDIRATLDGWNTDYVMIVAENGRKACIKFLRECVVRAKDLKKDEIVEGFNRHLSDLLIVDEELSDDPYAVEDVEDIEIDSDYGVFEEDDAGMQGQDGKGVEGKKIGEVDIGGSGKKQSMDSRGGKGITGKGTKGEVMEDESPTGTGMGDRGGTAVSDTSAKSVDGKDGSSAPGSSSKQSMDGKGGTSVPAAKPTDSDGSSGSEGGSGSAQTMDGRGGSGVQSKGLKKVDGTSGQSTKAGHTSDKGSMKGGTTNEGKKCKKCKCSPCECDEIEENQYKDPTRRRRGSYERSSLEQREDLDREIDSIAENIEEELDEGKLPPWLDKYKKKKKGEGDDGAAEEGEGDDAESVEEGMPPEVLEKFKAKKGGSKDKDADEKCGTCGEAKGVCECEDVDRDDGSIEEDNDITQPDSGGYDTEDASRKDGSGKMRRKAPKLSTKDFDGTNDKAAGKGTSYGEGGEKLPNA